MLTRRHETAATNIPRVIERRVEAVTLLSQQEINALCRRGWRVMDVERHTTRQGLPYYTYVMRKQAGVVVETRSNSR